NNDGLNDICRPRGFNIASIDFTIFDDNTNVMFTSNVPLEGWNPITPDNTSIKYYYKIQAITNNGNHIGLCGEVYRLTCFPKNLNKTDFTFESQLTINGFTAPWGENIFDCN